MSREPHVALRMCMGCGGRSPQRELLRVRAAPDGTLDVGRERTSPGRTGYLHPQRQCWEQFARRKGPVRSLRRSVDRTTRAALLRRLNANELSQLTR